MTKTFWNVLKVSPVIAASLFVAHSASAAEVVKEKITSVAQLSQEAGSIGQATSVSQFTDVQPTDWAFQALRSLVERYGCIASYPNGTFRGNRALTRYEFAAGLNSCLDRVNELIATATADMISKEDLSTLQRLQEEYASELATIRGRVDAVEARTAELEAKQFSTTTKLRGEVIFGVAQVFGDKRADTDINPNNNADLSSNTTFSDRVRLTLTSSFTGKDRLETRLQAGNFVNNSTITGVNNMARLGHDTSTNPANSVVIDKLNYAVNLTDAINVRFDATGARLYDTANSFSPDFASSGSGSISRYGRFSPIYRQGFDGAGLTVNIKPNSSLHFTAAYIAQGAAASDPSNNQGLFNGNSTIFGQLAIKPVKAIDIGLTYSHNYQVNSPNLFNSTGSALANNPFGSGTRTEANNYGVAASLKVSPKITLGGWGGYTSASSLTGAARSAEIWYWAATLGIKDFGREGNTLGFVFGQPPKLSGVKGTGTTTDIDTSYHIEGLYKMKVSDNVLVTPGVLVILNPNHNDNNEAIYVGTLRTTFTF